MVPENGVMIDIETFGQGSAAVIASIAAVKFPLWTEEDINDILNNEERVFYKVVDITSQKGRSFDGGTVKWWLQQNEQARAALYGETGIPLEDALRQLVRWYPPNWDAFSFGATFDLVILQHAYQQYGIQSPFPYRNALCARTIIKLSDLQRPRLDLPAHNALYDAALQAVWFQKAINKISGYVINITHAVVPNVAPSQE